MFLLISFGYIHQNSLETPSNCSKDGLLEESYCIIRVHTVSIRVLRYSGSVKRKR